MKYLLTKSFLTGLAILFVLPASQVVNAGEIIFHDAANAKIAKLRTQARILKNTREQDVVPSALGAGAVDETQQVGQINCGSIEIANQVTPSIGSTPRATEVFILGDVINTGNDC